ncbi:MAG: hypothetical protein A3K60_02780 [Euryarchaeota archaeon RBG_19FT_COMBO_56_21]|nr:MAG: hypothetical protein A3K60_02780 [Euryarchaeota archaeon RBG_19FT_COMBO_56_21]
MGSGEGFHAPAWISGQAEKEAKSDKLAVNERRGQLAAVAGFLILYAFLALHHARSTGFFTDDFGIIAAILLYGMIVYGPVPMLIRFFVGRKNYPARLLEAFGMALFFVGQLYLLVTFPFDMAHFADPLPHSLEFLLDWISPTLAKWILGIGAVGSIVFTVYDYFLYVAVKERLSKTDASGEKPVE